MTALTRSFRSLFLRWFPTHWALWAVLTLGLALKGIILASGAVSFNSDEAVVALMARHILEGKWTFFFYGQRYMGSLDALLIAGAFAFLGPSVGAVRLVQVGLFTGVLLTTYGLAWHFYRDRFVATTAALLVALPPVLFTLYTTATLGGYGEALLFGNGLLWAGHRLSREGRLTDRPAFLLGVWAGLAFWAFGLVVVYLVPLFAFLLLRSSSETPPYRRWRPFRPPRYVLLLALGLLVGATPWWLGNLSDLSAGVAQSLGANIAGTLPTPGQGLIGYGIAVLRRLFNFVVLGLPALFGLRPPWAVEWNALPLAPLALALYLGGLLHGLRRGPADVRFLLGGIWLTLLAGFVLTPFGNDPSGRYFLPLYIPLVLFTGHLLGELRARWGNGVAWGLLAGLLLFNVVGNLRAVLRQPPGITTQFDLISHLPHEYDEPLMAFLRTHNGTRGYSNYWVSFRLAFLSDEEIILTARLPYKATLSYTPLDNRYPLYDAMVAASPTVVYVTSNLPALDDLLRQRFRAVGVTWREHQIGPYRIFYDLSRRVSPEDLDLDRFLP
ncbi:MAG TPA: hypothetical protein ENK56_02680 [Chloroflexi bacterium]|nr:hypothetical protein [Chloroflexota bacterium]